MVGDENPAPTIRPSASHSLLLFMHAACSAGCVVSSIRISQYISHISSWPWPVFRVRNLGGISKYFEEKNVLGNMRNIVPNRVVANRVEVETQENGNI